MRSRITWVALVGAGALLASVSGCGSAPDRPLPPAPKPSVGSGPSCPAGKLATRTSGTLTVGTADPAQAPWFAQGRPENGKGFESAVAYRVAQALGYPAEHVTWVRVPARTAITAGPQPYDIDLNEFSGAVERAQTVDFSSPYYLAPQAVITLNGAALAGVTTVAGLRTARLGAQAATTSSQAVTDLIKPEATLRLFPSRADAIRALRTHRVDGLVVDLPTAFELRRTQLRTAVIVGQLPQVGVPDRFGIVLAKDSPLTGCVSEAVDQLRQDGTLAALETTWLVDAGGARKLS